jgi:hypothetical protein
MSAKATKKEAPPARNDSNDSNDMPLISTCQHSFDRSFV